MIDIFEFLNCNLLVLCTLPGLLPGQGSDRYFWNCQSILHFLQYEGWRHWREKMNEYIVGIGIWNEFFNYRKRETTCQWQLGSSPRLCCSNHSCKDLVLLLLLPVGLCVKLLIFMASWVFAINWFSHGQLCIGSNKVEDLGRRLTLWLEQALLLLSLWWSLSALHILLPIYHK